MSAPDACAVVVVTYRNGPAVETTLVALADQLRDDDELVVVDNASGDGTASAARSAVPVARVLEQERNLGFAAGCHAGVAASSAPLVLLLNPDALVAPGCIDGLRAAASDRPDWGAWQALVTLPGGERINTSGGTTHFLGVGWAGRCGRPLSEAPAAPSDVSFASGAALMVRRDVWDRLGGFDDRYFMYGEDLDLSLRVWLAGHGVGVAPAARVEHEYVFEKGPGKWFLLERNRWWTVLGDYPRLLLALLAPALVLFELVLLAVAARGGWLGQKVRAQLAVARSLPAIAARRRDVQRTRAISAADFASRLSAELDSPYLRGPARVGPLVALQRGYWAAVRRLLSAGGAGRGC